MKKFFIVSLLFLGTSLFADSLNCKIRIRKFTKGVLTGTSEKKVHAANREECKRFADEANLIANSPRYAKAKRRTPSNVKDPFQ